MSGLDAMMGRARACTGVRVFVGSDPRQAPAEQALLRTLDLLGEDYLEVFWLRAGEPGFEVGPRHHGEVWNIGREPGHPKSGGWGTDFSCFRLAIPEICGFAGRAIYLDSDMLVLGEIGELWRLPIAPGRGWRVTSEKIMDVCVIDCAVGKPPLSIAEMRRGISLAEVRVQLALRGLLDPTLPAEWNCRDCVPEGAKLVHFTDVTTQPWRPWPESVVYRDHPDVACRQLWDLWKVHP